MSEILSLEMNGRQPGKRPFKPAATRKILIGVAITLLFCMAGLLSWLSLGQIGSMSAMFDGDVHSLNAPYNGVLAEVNVHVGEKVSKGQVIAQMGNNPPLRSASGGSETAGAPGQKNTSGPQAGISGNMRKALVAASDLAQRLDDSRNNEDRLRLTREEKVLEHVRALLALRSGKSESQSARDAEEAARRGMEAAKENFEQASLQRAAIERELDHIRQVLLKAGVLSPGKKALQSAIGAPNSEESKLIKSPCNGTIIKSDARAGMTVNANEPLFVIQPANDDPDSFWALGWYPLSASGKIRPGQPCVINVPAMGTLRGKVWEILPPERLPDSSGKSGGITGSSVTAIPVRIRFASLPPGSLAPGSKLACEIHTRSFLGFSGF